MKTTGPQAVSAADQRIVRASPARLDSNDHFMTLFVTPAGMAIAWQHTSPEGFRLTLNQVLP